jgi:hypothetical protein
MPDFFPRMHCAMEEKEQILWAISAAKGLQFLNLVIKPSNRLVPFMSVD